MLLIIFKILLAFLFGGMTLFSFGFAPNLFSQMGVDKARPIIRNTFPRYYVFIIGVTFVLTPLSYFISKTFFVILLSTLISTLYARQILMPQINRAGDDDNKKSFKRLHMLSVFIQLIQIGACGYIVALS